jgi:type IV secretion system protein VirD4
MTAPLGFLKELGEWAQHHPSVMLWVVGSGMALMVLGNLLVRRRRPPMTTHGTARFSTASEVHGAGLSTTHGVVIGQVAKTIYCDDWDTHLLTVGRTRSGKGEFHLKPTLRWFWREGSALIGDPKNGENYLATAAQRRQYGRVEAFTPYGRPQCCINVEDTIRWGDPREFDDALTIGQSMTAPRKMAKESEVSLHFRELAAMLLAAVQLHVGYTSHERSLPGVWRFLTQRPGTSKKRKLLATLDAIGKTAHVAHGVHEAIVTITNAIETIGGEREMGSIWSTMIRPLILYNSPYVAASTETSTLALRDLQFGAAPLSLYLLAPSPAAVRRLYPIYRVIVDVAITRLMEREGTAQPKDYGHRLLLALDEFPTYGYIPTIDAEVATMAGYGIKGWFLAQDIPQLDETYGEEAPIWGNTDVKIFHAPANDATARRISENFLGEMTVEYEVLSQSRGGRTLTPHRVSRALMTPDEVQMMAPGQGLAHVSGRGLRPFLFGMLGYDPHYTQDQAHT